MLNAAGMGGKMVSSCAENPAVGVFTQPGPLAELDLPPERTLPDSISVVPVRNPTLHWKTRLMARAATLTYHFRSIAYAIRSDVKRPTADEDAAPNLRAGTGIVVLNIGFSQNCWV
jgi:hypothetical protein